MVKNLVQRLGLSAGILAGSLGLNGCTGLTPQGDAFVQGMGELAVGTYVQEGIKGQVNPDASNITHNVNVNGGQRSYQNEKEEGGVLAFTFTKFTDLNNNGGSEPNEFFGTDKRVFSLSKDTLNYTLVNARNKSGTVTFRSYTEEGELVGEIIRSYSSKTAIAYSISPGVSPSENKKDILDKIKERGPGDYRLIATLEDGTTFASKVTLTE
jgi:hypothetical protein